MPQNYVLKMLLTGGLEYVGKWLWQGPCPLPVCRAPVLRPSNVSPMSMSPHILLPLLTTEITNGLWVSFLLSLNEESDSFSTQRYGHYQLIRVEARGKTHLPPLRCLAHLRIPTYLAKYPILGRHEYMFI